MPKQTPDALLELVGKNRVLQHIIDTQSEVIRSHWEEIARLRAIIRDVETAFRGTGPNTLRVKKIQREAQVKRNAERKATP